MATILEDMSGMLGDISPLWALPLLSIFGYIASIISVRLQGPKAPLVGLRSIFEPRAIANYRFFKNSSTVIEEGYSKVFPVLTDLYDSN